MEHSLLSPWQFKQLLQSPSHSLPCNWTKSGKFYMTSTTSKDRLGLVVEIVGDIDENHPAYKDLNHPYVKERMRIDKSYAGWEQAKVPCPEGVTLMPGVALTDIQV